MVTQRIRGQIKIFNQNHIVSINFNNNNDNHSNNFFLQMFVGDYDVIFVNRNYLCFIKCNRLGVYDILIQQQLNH
ncbi:unnamed protein product [Paramecium sonneborni]|uniref:Uncharacterized protein n=1 Tax=Paramecium sonneborni TaxID=65129 RepID=A0A8S1NSQ5_9CILI|nr:unnamed protein product [Paramecium sonneborni]